MTITRHALFGKLGSTLFKSVESATTFCKLRGNPYVELVHWLHQLAQLPDSDLHRILRHCDIDTRAQMRDILQRDLAFLLNTTSIEDQIDRVRYPEAAASTVNFGVPPLAGKYLASRKWADLEHVIRRAIREFEPRLMPDTLAVIPLMKEGAENNYNVLMFEVRGMIHMDPYPLEFLVQSSIDLETSRMNVANVHAM